MITEILDSKYKSIIVPFLLLATPRTYSLIELSKRLSIPQAKLKTEMQGLAKLGIIKTYQKNKQSFYAINQKHKALLDLKHSLGKANKKFEDELFSAIKKLGEIKAAVLSGIFTGNMQLQVDILLVGKPNLNRLDEFLTNAKKMTGQEINYSIMSEDEYALRLDTFDRFIKDIFDYPHLVVFDNLQKPKKVK